MKVDVAEIIGTVTREVSSRQHEGKLARVVVATRDYDTHVHDLWEAGAAGVGWDMALMGLDRHVAGGAPVDPAEAMKWMTSDEGRRFIIQSSGDWGRAAIAAGEPEASAKAAVERTTSAYTAS